MSWRPTAPRRLDRRRRASEALRRYAILKITTNVTFLRRALEHPCFRHGRIDTGFIGSAGDALTAPGSGDALYAVMAAAAVGRLHPVTAAGPRAAMAVADPDPWRTLAGWQ